MTALDDDPVLADQDREYATGAYDEAPERPWATSASRLRSVPDRVTLYDTDAEAALLGAAMLSATARDALATLDPEAFGDPAHSHIAHAIQALHADGHPVDTITLGDHLRRHTLLELAGGQHHLIEILAGAPSTSGAHHYAGIVRDLHQLRRLGALGTEIAAMATTPGATPASAAQAAQALLDEIHDATTASTNRLTEISNAVDPYLDDLGQRQDQPLRGITTGFLDLDRTIGGFQDGRFYVIAGRPGMGKSDVAIHLGRSAADTGTPVLVTSIEMSTTELMDRWVAHASGISSSVITQGQIGTNGWGLVTNALAELQELPIWIDDNPATTMATIRADVRRSGARMVIVDYLQIVDTPTAESRQIEVTVLARALKRLARDLDIPVVALAQLNRGVEGRLDKRPQLADLRESGAIEQEADVVIGLYRDEQYHPDTKEAHVLELGALKNRTGPSGITIKVGYVARTKTFSNLAGANT